ncbi:adenosine deaminase [Allonocardiopsis opalescens]|uniref:adenosine deaminase n=1 Tax=Allonocardiopsis opalescens TaxID=1144618 RepID=UPI001FE6EA0B|nr:adenosine deaminase [Allonocardiopsis opalescens]
MPDPSRTGRDLALLPKAHLHVHLEAAVRQATLREIAAAVGAVPPEPPPVAGFDGFRAFADHNALVRACLRRPEDFTRVAEEFLADEAAQGVRYVEVTFTAASHGERLGDLEMPLAAVLAGLERGRAAHGVEFGVLLDHSRRRSAARFRRTLDLALRYAPRGVVGIGVAGDESHPLAPFAEVVDAAAAAGVRLVHHAGECAGAASVREAVGLGRAARIGHGFRVLEDPAAVAELRERAIPLELCPSSNVALGLVPSLAAHPLPALVAAGLAVTLNTDVPAAARTTLAEEYRRVRDAFGYGDAELAGFARTAADASFAPTRVRAELHAGIDGWLAGGSSRDDRPRRSLAP